MWVFVLGHIAPRNLVSKTIQNTMSNMAHFNNFSRVLQASESSVVLLPQQFDVWMSWKWSASVGDFTLFLSVSINIVLNVNANGAGVSELFGDVLLWRCNQKSSIDGYIKLVKPWITFYPTSFGYRAPSPAAYNFSNQHEVLNKRYYFPLLCINCFWSTRCRSSWEATGRYAYSTSRVYDHSRNKSSDVQPYCCHRRSVPLVEIPMANIQILSKRRSYYNQYGLGGLQATFRCLGFVRAAGGISRYC